MKKHTFIRTKDSGATQTEVPMTDQTVLVRFRDLRTMIPLSRTSIWRHVTAGTFPKPLRLSKNAIAWRRDELCAWIAEQTKRRDER